MQYLKRSLLLLFTLCSVALGWGQFTIPEKPKHQTSVYDAVSLLSASQRNSLEQKLLRYSDSTSTQIVVAIIASTEGEDINFLGAQWGQQWGIGQADKDNGVLLLLAREDRRVAISTGYGVEGALTDLMSRRIIESVIVPEFKKGNYYRGLDQGVEAIVQVLRGEFKADSSPGKDSGFPLQLLGPVVVFVILLLLFFRKRNNGGNAGGRNQGGPDLWDVLILSSLGRSSGSSGSFGGGFAGGFGGGGFGGGGASGGW